MEILTGGEDEESGTFIRLPASLFESVVDRDSIGIFFTFYDVPTLFPVSGYESDTSAPRRVEVGSQVIASTVGGANYTFENLVVPVETSFEIETVSKVILAGNYVLCML